MAIKAHNETINSREDYGQGYYAGTVTANADPKGLGMVQVTVPGLFDTQNGAVPWVGALKDSPFGFGTGPNGQYGVYGSPQVGSVVKIELQGGDPHRPLYTTLYTAPNANTQFASPTVWGYKDPDGNVMIYDMAAHTYLFTTRTGASIEIDATGKRITTVNGDLETSNGNWQVNVTGNAGITASGSATIQAATVNVTASGNATYTAALHTFNGPIVTDSTIAAALDITDSTSLGNTQTMANMRQFYDTHQHYYDDDAETSVPIQQIP